MLVHQKNSQQDAGRPEEMPAGCWRTDTGGNMSNFVFLKTEWTELYASARQAENLIRNDARSSCFYARRTLELAIEWLYQHDGALQRPYDNNLSALIYEPSFKNNLSGDLFLKVKNIKDDGNLAVHGRKSMTERDALRTAKELFHFLYWIARTYTRTAVKNYDGLNFDEAKVPPQVTTIVKQTVQHLKKLEEEIRQKNAELAKISLAQADTDTQIEQLKKEIAEAKKKNEAVPDTHDYSEAETRLHRIDGLLREAGWALDKSEDREFEVTGMPNEKGLGYADYVLWGDNGKPLAVVEAKRTSKDPRIGQQQAKLYADCLEKMTGQRPLIFYTNGYQTWLWDDLNYPPREVQGFYKKDELELLIQRRLSRRELAGGSGQ